MCPIPLLPGRFVFVLDGQVTLKTQAGKTVELKHNNYAYFPPGDASKITSSSGAGLLLYERIYALKVCKNFMHFIIVFWYVT